MSNPPENPSASGTAASGVAVAEKADADAADAADTVSADSVTVAVGVLDLVELTTPLGTADGLNVPQTEQSSEPWLALRHCSNVTRQIEFGTDPI